MTGSCAVIVDNDTLFKHFDDLTANTIVNCRLRLNPGEEHLLIDLLERGVTLIPSAASQIASRSKVHQAQVFSAFMLPNTVAVYSLNGLLEATSLYRQQQIERVVVKQDRKNGGLGIHLFADIEAVYNQAAFDQIAYPFVLQPFIENCRDIRIIWLGDYIEAYERTNPHNFRHNLHCGGTATPFTLTPALQQFCQDVMRRGSFPYAHMDLMLTEDGEVYLTEINLRGGLRGAQIDAPSYQNKVAQIHDTLVAKAREGLRC